MKRIFYLIWGIIALGLCHSCKVNKGEETALFSGVDMETQSVGQGTALSSVFKSHQLIPLETNDSSLIGGRGNKILKHRSRFYVMSQNTIVSFDKEGRYMNRLSSIGEGPEDYVSIYDYDVLTVGGKDEIWISTVGGIKIYDAENLSFKRQIPIEGFVNQFRYVNDSTIWVVSPEDKVFKICDADGNVRLRFGDKDLANSGNKFHQFFTLPGKVVYQLDDTQTGVVYDIHSDSMYYQPIILAEGVLSPAINKDYFDRYGYDEQMTKVLDAYVRISTVRTLGDSYLFTLFCPDGKKKMLVCADGKSEVYSYGSGKSLVNDIFPSDDLTFLSTVICCRGDDSFLFMIPAEVLNGDSEANPVLLEVCL